MTHALLLVVVLLTLQPASSSPTSQPESEGQAQSGAESTTVNRILDEMEVAGRDVRTIQCAVRYRVDDRLNLTESTRYGDIFFKRAEPNPIFLIRFDKLVADDIVHRDKQWWLFRNRWLWQIEGKSKTIIKREYVRPGEEVDFFDLQKAPFPVPFGQKREQILDNFTVSLVEPQVGDPAETDHLVCRPKPDAPLAREYSRLDFFIDQGLHLPVRIVAEGVRGDQVTVAEFPDLAEAGHINLELPDGVFDQPEETRSFHVTEEPLGSTESAGGP